MQIVLTLLNQVLIMFVLMGIGYILFKTGKISKEGSRAIGNILVYVVMPSVVIKAYMTEYSFERLCNLGYAFLFSFLALALSMAVAYIFFKKTPIENFGTSFSNAGFMGIPLTQAVLNSEAVFYASPFVALLNLFQWTYGVFVITKDTKTVSFKRIITNPILISILFGLFIYVIPFEMPDILSSSITYVSNMNAPLAMISLGIYLAQSDIKEMFKSKIVWLSSFVRLILIPLLTIFLLSLMPSNLNIIRLAILIVASAPVGSNVAIFAQIYNKDYTRATKSVCLSTLFSIITIPLIIMLAQVLWKV